MRPTKVVYVCDECGAEFYRNVAQVLVDDTAHCDVIVELIKDANGDMEEFPMCPCLGGSTPSENA